MVLYQQFYNANSTRDMFIYVKQEEVQVFLKTVAPYIVVFWCGLKMFLIKTI